MKLVSIIVPIYNVESFLKDCLLSISKQSYKNIEVLLINDGSTDNSKNIAINFAQEDSRFVYFEKENGGLSSARNYGIERANGEYICFVDSDDMLSELFVEKMLNLVNSTDTSVGVCSYSRFTNKVDCLNQIDKPYEIVNSVKKSSSLFKKIDSVQMMVAWNKIYKKELFSNIRYPVGKIHEDVGTTYKIFYSVQNFAITNEKLYYYRVNENSISLSKIDNRKLDLVDLYFEQMLFYEEAYKTDLEYKKFYIYASKRTYKVFGTLLSYRKDRYKDFKSFKKELNKSYKSKYSKLIKSKIGFCSKIIMLFSFKNVSLLMICSKIKRLFKK